MNFKHKNNIMKKITLLILLFSINLIQAQPGFDDDVEDVPAAPIDTNIELVAFLAIAITFFCYHKKWLKNN